MATNLNRVAQLLEASLDPKTNKQAELALRQEEKQAGFAIGLLHIVAADSTNPNARLSAAINFKNFIKRNWVDEDGNHRLPQGEVETIKKEIVGLMIAVPPVIQSQLGDAIGIIASSDFFRRWDTLVDDLTSRLTPDNSKVNDGVMQVAHSIFKRWRPLFRSDELFTEINHTLDQFGAPYLTLLQRTNAMIDDNMSNKATLRELLNSMNLLMKIFYDLSCQDLPPVFEENISSLSGLLQKYLAFDHSILTSDGDDAGPVEYIKSSIFEVLSLYTLKYGDAFAPFVGTFVGGTWTLLTHIGLETKYDILISKGLQFLTSIANNRENAAAFNNEGSLNQVVQKVVLPNLALRDSDLELFEDEPIEFIRRDLEGAGEDTRRKAATDFLRGLSGQFENLVTETVMRYVNHFLSEYAANPSANWRSKDTAVYLFSSIASKGAVTGREGVKTVNSLVNVIEFFEQNIASDLSSQDEIHPILKVDAVKYLYTFRSQLSRQQWVVALPLLVQHLAFGNYVIYTYAAIALERALALRGADGNSVISKDMVQPSSKALIEHLFKLIEKDNTSDQTIAATKIQENEFLMRCVMRVLTVVKDGASQITDLLVQHLVSITNVIALNPSNPRFCYYHFESVGALIRYAGAGEASKLESALAQPFGSILENDVADFVPYVFQLLAALLELHPSASLSDFYRSLIGPILKVDYWLAKGNVPALTRLLSSLISRASAVLISGNQIEPVLGIFKQLFGVKAHEAHAFDLLETVFVNLPPSSLKKYYTPIMQMVLTRLDNNSSQHFKNRFIRFYHFFSARTEQGLGADTFINILEQMQSGIFVPIYLKIILPDTPKLTRPLDRKIAVISLTKTLGDSAAFAEKYQKGWGYTCDRLLELLINPPVISQHEDYAVEGDVDEASFGVGYTPLVTIQKLPQDYWSEVTNVKGWVGEYLRAADSRHDGKIGTYVQERLSPGSKQALISVMQA